MGGIIPNHIAASDDIRGNVSKTKAHTWENGVFSSIITNAGMGWRLFTSSPFEVFLSLSMEESLQNCNMVGIGVGRSSKTVGWECLAGTNSQHDNNELFAICDDGMFMSCL